MSSKDQTGETISETLVEMQRRTWECQAMLLETLCAMFANLDHTLPYDRQGGRHRFDLCSHG